MKLECILQFSEKQHFMKSSELQFVYENTKYWGENHVLSCCNVMKHILHHFFHDIQNNFSFEGMFRFELMMISNTLQLTNLITLENDAIVIGTMSNHSEFNDERMLEMAKETWLKGNIVASFIQFSSLYDKGDRFIRTKLIKLLQCLIFFSVKKGGMAAVANIIELVKKFSYERNELSVLKTLWYALFSSSLYDDNCLSDTFLEDIIFKVYLEPFIPCFGANFLKHNEVGSYQRLIETSLTHNLDNAAGILLRLLFNYYYKTGYFSGCSAVHECCKDLDIKLTKDQIYKYRLLKKTGVKMKSKCHRPKDLIYKF